jgi:RNA polymerase sigma-70 factor (ECF subfamily)
MTSDLSLVTQVAVLGDKRAFDELVRRYQSPIRRFFLNLTLGDEQLSDDLAQDTFIKAYMNIGKFRAMASFQTWLMRIAYNVFYDHYRKMRNEHSSFARLPKQELEMRNVNEEMIIDHSSFLTSHSSFKMDLHAALALLKPDERSCITLQLIDGYDIQKIAEITGIKEGTVKSHLSRGKEKMATYLKNNGYDRR